MEHKPTRPASFAPGNSKKDNSQIKAKKNSDGSEEIHAEATRWEGPMPRPEDLALYEEVVPGLAKQIAEGSFKEQDHRHEMNRMMVSTIRTSQANDFSLKRRGQNYGLICVILVIALCGYLISIGESKCAVIIATGVLASLAFVFVSGKLIGKDKKEKTEEQKAIESIMD